MRPSNNFPTFLNTGTTDETLQQSGRQDSFNESSGSQFLRTTTGIQLVTDAFDESRSVMTFLTMLRVNKKYYTVSG